MDMRAFPGKTYRFYTGIPQFPFGYGLSYTKFNFSMHFAESSSSGSQLQLGSDGIAQLAVGDSATLIIAVQNVGKCAQQCGDVACVSPSVLTPHDCLPILFILTGTVTGDVAVLAFISAPPSPSQECPLSQLFHFAKAMDLAPGAVSTFSFAVDGAAAQCYQPTGEHFVP